MSQVGKCGMMYVMLLVKQKSTLVYGLVAIVSALTLTGLFLGVDPSGKALILIFIPVLLAWLCIFSAVQILTRVFTKPRAILTAMNGTATTAVLLLMLLAGINQLTPTDIVLVLLFASVSGFYLYRTWS